MTQLACGLNLGVWRLQTVPTKIISTVFGCQLAPVIFQTGIGLILGSFPLAMLAAQFESNQLALFAAQSTHTNISISQQGSSRINNTGTSTASNNLVFCKASCLPVFPEFKNRIFWITSIRWSLTTDDKQASLSSQLRLEPKGGQIEIRPLQHSIWITWRKALP